MPSGGARGRSGPVPQQDSLRRDRPSDQATWTHLPAAGRQGEVPAWPLAGRSKAAERRLWSELWAKPQAIEWERNGQELEVALYVRSALEASQSGAPAALRSLVVRQQEMLGLSLAGLMRNRWIIAQDVAAPAARRASANAASVKDRVRVIAGGA